MYRANMHTDTQTNSGSAAIPVNQDYIRTKLSVKNIAGSRPGGDAKYLTPFNPLIYKVSKMVT